MAFTAETSVESSRIVLFSLSEMLVMGSKYPTKSTENAVLDGWPCGRSEAVVAASTARTADGSVSQHHLITAGLFTPSPVRFLIYSKYQLNHPENCLFILSEML